MLDDGRHNNQNFNSVCSFDAFHWPPVHSHFSFCCKSFARAFFMHRIHFCSIDACFAACSIIFTRFCVAALIQPATNEITFTRSVTTAACALISVYMRPAPDFFSDIRFYGPASSTSNAPARRCVCSAQSHSISVSAVLIGIVSKRLHLGTCKLKCISIMMCLMCYAIIHDKNRNRRRRPEEATATSNEY